MHQQNKPSPLEIFTGYPKPKHIQIQPTLVKAPFTVEFAEKYVADLIREYDGMYRKIEELSKENLILKEKFDKIREIVGNV